MPEQSPEQPFTPVPSRSEMLQANAQAMLDLRGIARFEAGTSVHLTTPQIRMQIEEWYVTNQHHIDQIGIAANSPFQPSEEVVKLSGMLLKDIVDRIIPIQPR